MMVFMILQMLTFTSCSDDDDNNGWPTETDKTEIFIERFSTLVTNLAALQDRATYGKLKDNYPVSSKAMLDDEIIYLEETIAKPKEGNKKLANSKVDHIIREANQIEKNFRTTRCTEDFLPVATELLVNGKDGGYIDFGIRPEHSVFDKQGQQAPTVEFWVRLTNVDECLDSSIFLPSTFTDDDTRDHERRGWAVNSHFGRLRMTYDMGYSDLFEPDFPFDTLNRQVHVIIVTNESGVDEEVRDGISVITKTYVNDQLMLSKKGRDDRLPYTPNDKEVAMVAFIELSVTVSRIGEKSINGCMCHLHIQKSAKTQTEIQHLMDAPESVTRSGPDLVCGWTLNKTILDSNNIKDLAGKFSTRLIGDFQWIENR